MKAKLEPYLGFLHSVQYSKPSLVCDFEEFYRHLIDDFLIQYSYKLKESDFILKEETFSANRRGKRQYLNDEKTTEFIKKLNSYFLTVVKIPRINLGKKQELESLISEETSLFAKYLRCERPNWILRVPELL